MVRLVKVRKDNQPNCHVLNVRWQHVDKEENASSKNEACGHLPSAVSLEDKTTELPGPQACPKTSQIRLQPSGEISQSGFSVKRGEQL